VARYWVAALVVAIGCRFNFDPVGGSSSTNDSNVGSGTPQTPDAGVACEALQEASCIAAGGTCNAGICTIVAPPGAMIVCPSMMECHVLCAANTCDDGLICPAMSTCAMVLPREQLVREQHDPVQRRDL
jgi:hypothetical protein